MKVSCEGLSGPMQMEVQSIVEVQSTVDKKRPPIKARALMLFSALLFAGYVGNILLSMLALHYGVDVFHLDNVWEFLMLFGGAAGSIMFVLLNESHDS